MPAHLMFDLILITLTFNPLKYKTLVQSMGSKIGKIFLMKIHLPATIDGFLSHAVPDNDHFGDEMQATLQIAPSIDWFDIVYIAVYFDVLYQNYLHRWIYHDDTVHRLLEAVLILLLLVDFVHDAWTSVSALLVGYRWVRHHNQPTDQDLRKYLEYHR